MFTATTQALPNNIKIGEINWKCPRDSYKVQNNNVFDLAGGLFDETNNDIHKNNVLNNLFCLEGGLFEETNSVEEIAFKYAVDHINRFSSLASILIGKICKNNSVIDAN